MGRDIQRQGDSLHDGQGHVGFTALHRSDVGAMQPGTLREIFLSQVEGMAMCCYASTEVQVKVWHLESLTEPPRPVYRT